MLRSQPQAQASRQIAEREEFKQRSGSRAMALLGAAQKLGYFKTPENLEKLRKDPQFESLRGREDFKKFLISPGD